MARAEVASPKRTRIQLELSPEQVGLLDLLRTRLGSRTRSDLLQDAIGLLAWYAQETLRGRKVVSVDPDEVAKLQHVVELARPVASLGTTDLYRFLIARPHPYRKQLSLKGRNMTVGQLLASMRAEDMTAAEAAEQFSLPLEQVEEALVYYAANEELIDAEFREDRRQVHEMEREAGGLALLPGRLRGRPAATTAARGVSPGL